MSFKTVVAAAPVACCKRHRLMNCFAAGFAICGRCPARGIAIVCLVLKKETRYLNATTTVGESIQEAYRSGLEWIRATMRGEQPIEPADPFLLRDVSTLPMDCGLRPEECFRLQWEHIREDAVHVPYGKTANARQTIPLSQRAAAILEIRRSDSRNAWVFPAPTHSGHVEKSALKKQHPKACKERGCLSALQLPAHLLDPLGRPHGSIYVGRPSWSP